MQKVVLKFSKVFLIYVVIFLIIVAGRGGNLKGLGPVLRLPFYPMEVALETFNTIVNNTEGTDILNNGHLYDPNDSLPERVNLLEEDLFILNTVRNNGEPFIEIRNLRNDSIINSIPIPMELQTDDYRQRYFVCQNEKKNMISVYAQDNNKIGLFDLEQRKYNWICNTDNIILHHRLKFEKENLLINIRRIDTLKEVTVAKTFFPFRDIDKPKESKFWNEGFAFVDIESGEFLRKWFLFDHISELPDIISFQGTVQSPGDYWHLNDVEVVNLSNGVYGALENDDILLSARNLNAVIHVRRDSIISTYTGLFSKQHDVDVVDANTISVFNNNSHDVKYPWLNDYKTNIIYHDLVNSTDSIAFDNIGLSTYSEGQFIQNGDYRYFENQNQHEIIIMKNDKIVYRGQQFNAYDKEKVNLLNWCTIFQ